MTSQTRRRPAAGTVASLGALAIVLAGGVTACSSSTAGAGLTVPSSIPSARMSAMPSSLSGSARASASSTAGSSTARIVSPTNPHVPASADLRFDMLRPDEIGHGFAGTDSDTSDSPLPCTPDSPGVLTAVPPQAQGVVDFASPVQDKQIAERLAEFDTAGTAKKALDLVRKGFGCQTARVGGDRIDFVGPTELTGIVPERVDDAEFWQVRTAAYEAEVFVVRDADRLMMLQFSYLSGGTPTQVDQRAVLDTAIQKAQGAG